LTTRISTGIAYAPADPPGSSGHLLDLYLPDAAAPLPVLVVLGGSAFRGDQGSYYAAELAPWFTTAGFAVVGVSTRSSRQARFPAQVHDVKAAIRWLRAHAAEHGLDPDRIAVLGDSSGGWTAAMAGLAGDELEGDLGVTGVSSRVQAVVDLYGPTDFLLMDAHQAATGNRRMRGPAEPHDDPASPESQLMGFPIQTRPDDVRVANPATHAGPGAPPFLIAHGQLDPLVPHHQSELLYEALAAAGAEVTFYSVPGFGHDKGIVSPAVAEPEVRTTRADGAPGARPTLETIERFLRGALGC